MHTFALFIPFLLCFAQGQLNELAKAAGLKYLGTAIDNDDLSVAAYIEIASNIREFGQITPGNPQKWGAVEPFQDDFTFSEAEEVTGFANKNGQMLRCHNLLWHIWLPEWVPNGSWTKESLTAVLQKHITTEALKFKGQCYAWDVVNEAIEDDGTIRKTIWSDTIGDDFIRIAFETAAAADPDVKLYYNDYAIEMPGPKRDGVLALVKSLQASGTKIDGVGLQSHFTVGQTPAKEVQIENMEAFTALGIEVAITELDISNILPSTAADEAQQSKDFENTVAACVAVKNCIGITMWGFDDERSWLNVPGSRTGEPCVFDGDLNRKPAYYGVVAGLLGPSGLPVTSQSTTATASNSQTLSSTTAAGLPTQASSGNSINPSSSSASATIPISFTLVNITSSTTFSTIVSPAPTITQGLYSFTNSTTSPTGTVFSGGSAGAVGTTASAGMGRQYHHHHHHCHGRPSPIAADAKDGSTTSSINGPTTMPPANLNIASVTGVAHDAGCRCPQCLGT